MENRELAEDATPGKRDHGEDATSDERQPAEEPTAEDRQPGDDSTSEERDEESSSDEEEHKLFGLIPMKVAVPLVVGLPILGFLLGMIGAGDENTTVPVDFVISAQQASAELQPGASSRFTVVVQNPTDSGVQVTSISAGASESSGGCPAGAVTSQAIEGPPGYIGPNGTHAYLVTATMAPTAGEQCTGQAFTLPLTAELVSAG